MVDKYHNPLQTDFGAVFGEETVQTGLLSPEGGSMRVLLLSHASISPPHDHAPTSGCDASQADTFGKGQESTSRAVHRRVVLPAAMAGVRWRSRCATSLPPRSRGETSATWSDA